MSSMWLCWRPSSAAMAECISGSRLLSGAVLSMCGEATLAQTGPEAKLFRGRRGRPSFAGEGASTALLDQVDRQDLVGRHAELQAVYRPGPGDPAEVEA